MIPTVADLKRLRWALASLLVLALIGAGAVHLAATQAARADADIRQARAQRQEIQSRLARASDEEAEIREKIGLYHAIEARGLIGLERRLDWVERIAQIRTARRLIDIQYELSPQKPVEPAVMPGGAFGGSYEFMSSTMRLQMQLLHEDDLLGFISDLAGSVQAQLHVRNCRIERIAKTGQERGPSPQLRADCTIDWITLREKK
jgi:hypothetical protein